MLPETNWSEPQRNRSSRKNPHYFDRCLLFVAVAVSACAIERNIIAHEPVTEAEQQSVAPVSAGSLLDVTRPNGRIGGYQYGGSLTPTPGINSRFTNSGDVKYGSAGNIVGISGLSSRFGTAPNAPFQSKNNFDLLRLRNEYRRAMDEYYAARNVQNAPRLITATAPQKFPSAKKYSPAYGKTREQFLAEQDKLFNEALQPGKAVEPEKSGSVDPAQRIWMRGQNPRTSSSLSDAMKNGNLSAENAGLLDYSRYGNWGPDMPGALNGNLGGAVGENLGNAWTFPPLPKTQAEQYEMFIEELEGQLLSSPDVTPLSPVQIDFQDGVATVRGVVPTPTARVAAGKILLADPRVKRVNNLMTYIRNDDSSSGLVPVMPEPVTDVPNN